jgi:choline dehydrogenase
MSKLNPSPSERSYDYIVIGSGPAGATLAAQLSNSHASSNSRRRSVLVIEAGSPHRGPLSSIPAFYPRSFGSRIDWNYMTTPQTHLAKRSLKWPAGKVLGGSSAINAMIRIEPSEACLQTLHTACGPTWSVESSKSLFDRLRNELHCSLGPLSSLTTLHPNTAQVHRHAIENSFGSPNPWIQANPTIRPSIAPYLRFTAHGRRRRILSQNRSQPIPILSNAMAKRLILDSDRAVGVIVQSQGDEVEVLASKEVILCCGAIETPRLLFQSGIGPRTELAQAGLECRYPHERIGSGLQDHLVYPLVFRLRKGVPFSLPLDRVDRRRYIEDQGGPKSSNLAELGAWIDPHGIPSDQFQWHITPTHYLAYPKIPNAQPCVSIGVTQSHPQSVGSVLPDPSNRSRVLIDPNYLSVPDDRTAFQRAIHWSREFFHSAPWQDLFEEELMPGPKRASDEALLAHIERFATTLYHYTGTCAMGLDRQAPVDPEFRLRGIERLRVCDASVFPVIPGSNPQTTIMMMAMRLAALLLEE